MSGGTIFCCYYVDAAAAAVSYNQSLSNKGPDRVGELTGAVANHYLVMWPTASFCAARVIFASSLLIVFGIWWYMALACRVRIVFQAALFSLQFFF